MKASIAAARQAKQSQRMEFMLAAIYKQLLNEDPPSIEQMNIGGSEAADVQTLNPADGVDAKEASASGRALRQRRTEKGRKTTQE